MSDQPNEPVDPEGEPDPAVTAALRSMPVPPHGSGFWAEVDGQVGAQAPTGTVRLAPVPQPAPFPPSAEVTPPATTSGRRFPRWLALAAAAIVAVAALGAAVLARTTGTEVETTAASSSLPAETTALATTTLPPAPTVTTAPVATAPQTTPKPTAAPTTSGSPKTTGSALTATPGGIGPLRIGMTIKQTAATGAVGPYDDPLETGGSCGYASPAGTYRSDDFSALFLNGRLARLYIGASSRVRTPEGVGVGSASSKLVAIAGTRTESPHPYQAGTNVDIMRGGVGYQFTVDGGKVTEWSVGTREGLSLPEGCA